MRAAVARAQRVEHAGRKGIASADTVDDAGQRRLLGQRMVGTHVDPRGKPVQVDLLDMPRGRSDRPSLGKAVACLASPLLAVSREGAAEQQGDVAVIAEQQVGLRNESRRNAAWVAIPALPQTCRANCRRTR